MAESSADICLVTGGHWSIAKGGAPFQAACLADRLVERGRARLAYVARTIDASVSDGYPRYQVASPRFLHRLGFSVDAPWLYRTLSRIGPKVIYQRGLQAYTGFCAMYARRAECRLVYHVASDYDVIPLAQHETGIHSGYAVLEKRLGEFGLRNADQIVVQSAQQARLLEKNYGLTANRIIRNFHPDAVTASPNRRHESPVEVVWVGNLKPVKRPELFVDLAEAFADQPGIAFSMIGAGLDQPLYAEIKARIDRMPNLKYLGRMDQADINDVLDRAHLLVCTSRSEGFPNTFIQAWQRGTVVVSLGIDPDGVLSQGGSGVCCSDFDSLRKAVDNLASNLDLRGRIAGKGMRHVRSCHSMSNADELAELLEGLTVLP